MESINNNYPIQQSQNQDQNNQQTRIQISFKQANQFASLEADVISHIDALIGNKHCSIEKKQFQKHQTIILEYQLPNKKVAKQIILKHNLEYTGLQLIHIEEKVQKKEYRAMQLYNKVILKSYTPINLKEIFTYIFEKFGEIFRIKHLDLQQKIVQVIFRNSDDYQNFLFHLKKNIDQMGDEIFFQYKEQQIYVKQFSITSLNIEKPQPKQILNYQHKLLSNENKLITKYIMNCNHDEDLQGQSNEGDLFKITFFSDLEFIVKMLKKYGQLIRLELKNDQYSGYQQILFQYKSKNDDKKIMKAYKNLYFTNLDNLNILISRDRCKFQDQRVGCTNRHCLYAHVKYDKTTCRNIFYTKCREYKQNDCEYLHIGPKTIDYNNDLNKFKKANGENNSKINSEDSDSDFNQNEELEFENPCKICYMGERTTLFRPCNHFAYCKMCADIIKQDFKKCPYCKQPIQQTLVLKYK